jgi:hypothetical protein
MKLRERERKLQIIKEKIFKSVKEEREIYPQRNKWLLDFSTIPVDME